MIKLNHTVLERKKSMYFAILMVLCIYLVVSMVLTAWYFSSWELLSRFCVLASPFIVTLMLGLGDFRKQRGSQFAKSSSFTLFFYCVLFTVSMVLAFKHGSVDFYLDHLPTFDSALEHVLSSIKKTLSYFEIKFK